jgi:hypothetical protein
MDEAARSNVAELRVHGVGGATTEGLLGVHWPDQTARVAGGGSTTFVARRADPGVEGYLWGRLSAGATLQPLWLLLLPFTLLNVAGWMHQPPRRGGRGAWRLAAQRLVVGTLGLSLTMTSVVWLAIIAVDVAAYQWGRVWWQPLPDALEWIGGTWVRIGLGTAAVGLVIALAARVASSSQFGFEAIHGPAAGREPPPGEPPGSGGPLADPSFWEHEDARRLLLWHRLAALTALLLALAQAVAWAAADRPTLQLGAWIVVFGTAQALLLLVLLVLDLLALGDRRDRARVADPAGADRWPRLADGFRFFGPTVTATIAIALSNAAFAGWTRLVSGLLERASAGVAITTGAEFALLDVLGVAALLLLAALVVTLLVHLQVDPRAVRRLAGEGRMVNLAPPAHPLDGLPTGWRPDGTPHLGFVGSVARARRLSNLLRNVDLALTFPAVVFLLLTAIAGLRRIELGDPAAPWPWLPSMDPLAAGIPLAPAAAQRWLAAFAAWLVLTGTWLGVALLRTLVLQRSTRRLVGIFWDVLTFWPRRYHPFAVRPYSERAVPELQQRIAVHVAERRRPLVVAAHSQGTVLAVAALLARPGLASGVGLVTMGSPLAQLYARFFPAYFGLDGQFHLLRARLAAANPELGMQAWTSFFRETDYIGKRVFGDGDPGDVCLDDPALLPDPEPPLRVLPPDPPRLGYTELARHSLYFRETEVRVRTARLRAGLAAVTAPPEVASPGASA